MASLELTNVNLFLADAGIGTISVWLTEYLFAPLPALSTIPAEYRAMGAGAIGCFIWNMFYLGEGLLPNALHALVGGLVGYFLVNWLKGGIQ